MPHTRSDYPSPVMAPRNGVPAVSPHDSQRAVMVLAENSLDCDDFLDLVRVMGLMQELEMILAGRGVPGGEARRS